MSEYLKPVPKLVTQEIARVPIGREILPVVPLTGWKPSGAIISLINALNTPGSSSEELRRSFRFSLNNNTTNNADIIAHERAVSAYFTYNPNNETVIIEWGQITSDGTAKLHWYLNQAIDYRERNRQGMKSSSGHFAKTKVGLYVALFDNLGFNPTSIEGEGPMGKTINTMYAYSFVPIDSEGFVQLPAF